ncbi:MAG: glycosyltransferase [Nostocaceae cyanobacterium]|nr:glycosyltransferase [Nostocaceae cyanobacterium]
MPDQPLVSIIIKNYNYGLYLAAAIDSALNQTYPNIEVIIVDDGSSDNSREIISKYQGQSIAVLKENGGQPSVLNAGFAASLGDIICTLDSDDIFAGNKVEEVVNVFLSHPEISWCFHPLRLVDIKTKVLLGTTIAFPQRENISSYCDFRAQMKSGRVDFYAPSTSALSFKRSLLEKMMPLAEDYEFCQDRYLTHVAMALSTGFFLSHELTTQGIHGNNISTLRTGKEQQRVSAKIALSTAYCIKNKFPYLVKFTNRTFARGLSHYWRSQCTETKYREIIEKYFFTASLVEKLYILVVAIYHIRPYKKVNLYKLSGKTHNLNTLRSEEKIWKF